VFLNALVGMIGILNITTILIGGGLSASFNYIMPALNYRLMPCYFDTLTIKKATLGNDAGLLGVASLCF
jgi:glucokinase